MKQITFTLFTLLLCVSLSAAEYLKVGQTRTLSVGSISHLQGCQWTISRPSNVTFLQTPGTFDTSATIKATQGFSGSPCIVQCKYYYLEQDPITGRYTYSRSGYKSWNVFVEENSGEDNPVENPDIPESKQIRLASNEVSVNAYGLVDIEVYSGYDRIIKWRIEDKSIAKGTPLRDGWTLRVEGVSPGTTWAYASDAGGGQAVCKITVKQRQYTEGETIRYPNFIDAAVPQLAVKVTDVSKKECCLTRVDDDYNANQADGVFVVPEKICGLTVVKIGNVAFSSKTKNIKKVILPNTIREIDNHAFRYCELEEIELPIGLETIGHNAFASTNLKSISIPEGVTSIGEYAFTHCGNLTAIDIPKSVTSIGQYAFWDCSSLTSINIPEGVTSIGQGAFAECNSLTSINIPEGVTSIGDYAFSACSGLTSIVVASGNRVYDSRNGCNAIIRTSDNCLVQGCKNTVIPVNVTSIGANAFYGCSSLTSINIPKGVTNIGESAFWSCSGLTSINIPESVTSIGGYAFWDCSSLTSINIPKGVTNIGESAFWSCSSLTSIVVASGNSVYDSRNDCNAIIRTSDNSLVQGCKNTVIPVNVTSIKGAFAYCSSLTSINIPKSVTSIGSEAFWSCSGLTSVNIPEGVTSIGARAFCGCSGLTSINIPEGVIYIGVNAFWGCASLADIYCYVFTPADIVVSDFNPFSQETYSDCTLHVPYGTTDAYKAANTWKNFFRIAEFAPTGVEAVSAGGKFAAEQRIYNLGGMRMAAPQKGLNIINGKKVMVK